MSVVSLLPVIDHFVPETEVNTNGPKLLNPKIRNMPITQEL